MIVKYMKMVLTAEPLIILLISGDAKENRNFLFYDYSMYNYEVENDGKNALDILETKYT